MDAYLAGQTEYGWYLCLDGDRIVGGLGVIENDFHDRKDLSPNLCAVYVDETHRRRGIAGRLLGMAVEDLRGKGVSPVYLLTDHTGFYERYGWEFPDGRGEAPRTSARSWRGLRPPPRRTPHKKARAASRPSVPARTRCPSVEGRRHPAAEPLGLPTKGVGWGGARRPPRP